MNGMCRLFYSDRPQANQNKLDIPWTAIPSLSRIRAISMPHKRHKHCLATAWSMNISSRLWKKALNWNLMPIFKRLVDASVAGTVIYIHNPMKNSTQRGIARKRLLLAGSFVFAVGIWHIVALVNFCVYQDLLVSDKYSTSNRHPHPHHHNGGPLQWSCPVVLLRRHQCCRGTGGIAWNDSLPNHVFIHSWTWPEHPFCRCRCYSRCCCCCCFVFLVKQAVCDQQWVPIMTIMDRNNAKNGRRKRWKVGASWCRDVSILGFMSSNVLTSYVYDGFV